MSNHFIYFFYSKSGGDGEDAVLKSLFKSDFCCLK